MIAYPIGTSGQAVILTDAVLRHFRMYQQTRWWRREAGGQLFAKFEGPRILVVEATGPRDSDRRTRTTYRPDQAAEREEILARHAAGLHFIGDWHTHPERRPTPSPADLDSIAECVRRSRHALAGFVLVIVGTAEGPAGLHLLVHDGATGVRLDPHISSCPPPPWTGSLDRSRAPVFRLV